MLIMLDLLLSNLKICVGVDYMSNKKYDYVPVYKLGDKLKYDI